MIESINQIMVQNSKGIFFYPRYACKVCGNKYFADDPSTKGMSTTVTCTRCTIAFKHNDPENWGKA